MTRPKKKNTGNHDRSKAHDGQMAAAAHHAGRAVRLQNEGKTEEAQAAMLAGLFTLFECGCKPEQWPNILREIYAAPWLAGVESWLEVKEAMR